MTTGPRVSKSSADRMDSSQQAGGHSSAPSSPTPSGSDAGTWHLRNIPCPRPGCGRLYSSNSSLRNHLRRKHKGILSLDTSSSAAAPTPASLSQVIGPPIVSPQEPQKYQIYPLPRNPQQHPPLAEARSMPATRRFSGDMQPMAHSQQGVCIADACDLSAMRHRILRTCALPGAHLRQVRVLLSLPAT